MAGEALNHSSRVTVPRKQAKGHARWDPPIQRVLAALPRDLAGWSLGSGARLLGVCHVTSATPLPLYQASLAPSAQPNHPSMSSAQASRPQICKVLLFLHVAPSTQAKPPSLHVFALSVPLSGIPGPACPSSVLHHPAWSWPPLSPPRGHSRASAPAQMPMALHQLQLPTQRSAWLLLPD